MPEMKHKDAIQAFQAFIADIRKSGSIPLDTYGKPVRPMQEVCIKGKSYTILSVHYLCADVWAARLQSHTKKEGVIVRTPNEVVGW